MRRLQIFGLMLIAAVLCVFLFSNKAHAATFTVTDNGDASAVDPSVSCDTAGSVCTLRSAIEAANAQAGADSISFNIPGSGVHTITPGSAYPNITDEVTIDGSTQPGAQCGTLVPANLPQSSNTPHTLLIEVNGSNIVGSILTISTASANNSIVKGLVLNHAVSGNAIVVNGANNSTIECNYLGTNTNGSAAAGNYAAGVSVSNVPTITIQNNLISGSSSGNGIDISSDGSVGSGLIQNNLIGTDSSGINGLSNSYTGVNMFNTNGWGVKHNVVSGNNTIGINISTSFSVTVTGNFVGVNLNGSPLGNNSDGLVFFSSSNFVIGGNTATLRNVLSANQGDGLHIYNNCQGDTASANSTIQGNYIGTTASGLPQAGYGNQGAGIEVNEYQGSCGSVYRHQIGGDGSGESNIIAGNTNQGILVHQDSSHDVFSISSIGNSIYANGQFGIDLAADTGGDGIADVDLGPNLLNNFLMTYGATNANYYINRPVINSTSYTGNQLTVNYSLQAPGITDNLPYIQASNLVGFRLDFYLNDAGQDGAYSGYSQGKTHLGSFIVNGPENNANHTFTSPVTLKDGQTVTATTTVLWQIIPNPGTNCQGDIWGVGVPYTTTCNQ
ncbi:MAG: hypothetical protein U0516_00915 [Candidatus Saccharibacteria bacterium]